jgi:hypothetical protein
VRMRRTRASSSRRQHALLLPPPSATTDDNGAAAEAKAARSSRRFSSRIAACRTLSGVRRAALSAHHLREAGRERAAAAVVGGVARHFQPGNSQRSPAARSQSTERAAGDCCREDKAHAGQAPGLGVRDGLQGRADELHPEIKGAPPISPALARPCQCISIDQSGMLSFPLRCSGNSRASES